MKKNFKIVLSIFLYSFIIIKAFGQYHKLNIGDFVPVQVQFRNIQNYPSHNPTISDFKGKLVILDFWTTSCGACIAAIPKMEKLQQRFGDSIQILLLDPWENKEQVQLRMEKLKKSNKEINISKLPMVNGDTSWRVLFPSIFVPHHVWIDPNGKVAFITNGYNTSEKHIQEFLHGKNLKMAIKKDYTGPEVAKYGVFNYNKMDSVFKPAFFSGFTRFTPGIGVGNAFINDTAHQLFSRIWFNIPFLQIYQSVSSMSLRRNGLILETKQKKFLKSPKDGNLLDEYFSHNCYSYQITLPVEDKYCLQKYVLEDLNRFFGKEKGIKGEFEERELPALILVQTNKSILKKSLKVKGFFESEKGDTLKFTNTAFSTVSLRLFDALEDLSRPIAFVDETKFTDNVDMTLTGNLHDEENINYQLKKYGFKIIKGIRRLKVLVVKDINQ